jgi:DNA-binding NarL/FixJ family response regulator
VVVPQEPARVLLVDASQLITEGLRVSLQRTQRFRVVGIAHNAVDALRCLRGMLIDLVVTDLDVPGAGPLRTVRDAKEFRPKATVVVVTANDSREWATAASAVGASAYLLKTTPIQQLIAAIGEVMVKGGMLVDPRLGSGSATPSAELPPHPALRQLTARESEVLGELVKGLDNQTIAKLLFISQDTVKTHVKAILRKLGARDRAHAVAMVLSRRFPANGV